MPGITSRGCSRSFIFAVLYRCLQNVQYSFEMMETIQFPFPPNIVAAWLRLALDDTMDNKFDAMFGGTQLCLSDSGTFWSTPAQFNTWWKNNIERKSKFRVLIEDFQYNGDDEKLKQRQTRCYNENSLAIKLLTIPCRVPASMGKISSMSIRRLTQDECTLENVSTITDNINPFSMEAIQEGFTPYIVLSNMKKLNQIQVKKRRYEKKLHSPLQNNHDHNTSTYCDDRSSTPENFEEIIPFDRLTKKRRLDLNLTNAWKDNIQNEVIESDILEESEIIDNLEESQLKQGEADEDSVASDERNMRSDLDDSFFSIKKDECSQSIRKDSLDNDNIIEVVPCMPSSSENSCSFDDSRNIEDIHDIQEALSFLSDCSPEH